MRERKRSAYDAPEQSGIDSARVAPRPPDPNRPGDVLAGGDAGQAPRSLTEAQHRPSSSSGGVSWDDPEDL